MNRIYELAKEADEYADATLSPGEFHPDWHNVRDEKFAKLVAAHEREACALMCEQFDAENFYMGQGRACAFKIRARGEA